MLFSIEPIGCNLNLETALNWVAWIGAKEKPAVCFGRGFVLKADLKIAKLFFAPKNTTRFFGGKELPVF